MDPLLYRTLKSFYSAHEPAVRGYNTIQRIVQVLVISTMLCLALGISYGLYYTVFEVAPHMIQYSGPYVQIMTAICIFAFTILISMAIAIPIFRSCMKWYLWMKTKDHIWTEPSTSADARQWLTDLLNHPDEMGAWWVLTDKYISDFGRSEVSRPLFPMPSMEEFQRLYHHFATPNKDSLHILMDIFSVDQRRTFNTPLLSA